MSATSSISVSRSGTVEDVSLRTTRLRDVEGVVWYVPNGGIRRVGNKSQQWSRVVLDIPVSYGADIDRAQHVIAETAFALARGRGVERDACIAAPEVWGVEKFTLDTVTIRLVVKTAPHEQWRGRPRAAIPHQARARRRRHRLRHPRRRRNRPARPASG